MKMYAIAQGCVVSDEDGDFECDPETEDVVCIPLGLYKSMKKADKKCDALNKEKGKEIYQVISLEVKD